MYKSSGRINSVVRRFVSSCAGKDDKWERARLLHNNLVQQVLNTGDIAVATAREPGIPIFERTTLKNYHAVKLDITDPSDIQSAFATALDRFGRIDVAVNNVGTVDLLKSYQIVRSGHK